MTISEKQKGVLLRMILSALAAIAIVIIGSSFNFITLQNPDNLAERIAVAFSFLLFPVSLLVISVARLATHRFFTPDDLDGGGLSEGTERARVLQSILQNTLEQFCIASSVYIAWSVIMPSSTISVIAIAAIAFSVGRILFFTGYSKGAPSRALGFTLGFYPSVLMLVCIACYSFWKLIS
jgi:uncharacterized membrane protein YecN with MAPEG domain